MHLVAKVVGTAVAKVVVVSVVKARTEEVVNVVGLMVVDEHSRHQWRHTMYLVNESSQL